MYLRSAKPASLSVKFRAR